jgi:phosphonate metabolism protein (transferase hexapeptide repeat family)
MSANVTVLLPKITQAAVVHETAKVRGSQIGDWVEIHEFAQVRDSSIGSYSYLQEYVALLNTDMGRFCAIAAMSRLGAPNHPYGRVSQHRFTYVPEYYWLGQQRDRGFFDDRTADRVNVGHDVWCGHGVTVLPGVTVGDGAVIAAGAVVTKEVAPYTIVAGVPAKLLKPRFERNVAERLQAIGWWNWSGEKLVSALADFQSMSAEAFVEKYEKG